MYVLGIIGVTLKPDIYIKIKSDGNSCMATHPLELKMSLKL